VHEPVLGEHTTRAVKVEPEARSLFAGAASVPWSMAELVAVMSTKPAPGLRIPQLIRQEPVAPPAAAPPVLEAAPAPAPEQEPGLGPELGPAPGAPPPEEEPTEVRLAETAPAAEPAPVPVAVPAAEPVAVPVAESAAEPELALTEPLAVVPVDPGLHVDDIRPTVAPEPDIDQETTDPVEVLPPPVEPTFELAALGVVDDPSESEPGSDEVSAAPPPEALRPVGIEALRAALASEIAGSDEMPTQRMIRAELDRLPPTPLPIGVRAATPDRSDDGPSPDLGDEVPTEVTVSPLPLAGPRSQSPAPPVAEPAPPAPPAEAVAVDVPVPVVAPAPEPEAAPAPEVAPAEAPPALAAEPPAEAPAEPPLRRATAVPKLSRELITVGASGIAGIAVGVLGLLVVLAVVLMWSATGV
jgi:hypothetical protein